MPTLVLDADDTLWEDDVRFERVISASAGWRTPPSTALGCGPCLTTSRPRAAPPSGTAARCSCAASASASSVCASAPPASGSAGRSTGWPPPSSSTGWTSCPACPTPWPSSGRRHDLLLLTKGAPDEQRGEFTASGLGPHFRSVHVVAEEDAHTHRRLVADLGLDPARTWMIVGSPRSDVLPARAAGLGAVFIPNENTWVLEAADLDPADDGVLTLRAFRELLDHF